MPIKPNNSASTGASASQSASSTSQQQPSQPQQTQPGTTPTLARSSNMTEQSGNGKLSKEDAERQYEERMEEEYAKREGGA
ncbi:hypothetical protein AJ78_02962 [Emergomyces pasteurianus Ep9510]|uniref:Uncharacterized protein n=1 Tax=Emergomyces pasteurianus Ep9510 TaxID=1447872 RepID=A0A1J9QNU5_9EURO|nr:hypothetical protein AJ78_02962 [Emergomyces pasteurianus Ep9510]